MHQTTVAEEGNRRRGVASAEEIEQCILGSELFEHLFQFL